MLGMFCGKARGKPHMVGGIIALFLYSIAQRIYSFYSNTNNNHLLQGVMNALLSLTKQFLPFDRELRNFERFVVESAGRFGREVGLTKGYRWVSDDARAT